MFDVYMEGQVMDPRVRARMMTALLAAAALTVSAGALSWTAGKFNIHRVGPTNNASVMDLTLVTDMPRHQAEPPPRPQKPATEEPQVSRAATRPDAAPAAAPTEDLSASDDILAFGEAKPKRRSTDGGAGDGVPGIKGPKGAGCLGVGCVPNGPVGPPPTTRRVGREKEHTTREPLAAVKARAIFTPDPSSAALAKTKAGLGARRPGTVKIDFCVGPSGKVSSTKVSRRFGSDTAVDRVCLDAVKRWRFKPAKVGGKARTTCSEVSFEIRFDG